MIPYFYSQTAVYASGAGLGASKGKDIGKYAEGFGSYVDLAKHAVCHFLACFEGCLSSRLSQARERYGDSHTSSHPE